MLFVPLLGSLIEVKYQEECLQMPSQKSRTPLLIICTRNHLGEKCFPLRNYVIRKETYKAPGSICILKWHLKLHRTVLGQGWYFGSCIMCCIQTFKFSWTENRMCQSQTLPLACVWAGEWASELPRKFASQEWMIIFSITTQSLFYTVNRMTSIFFLAHT